MPNSLPKLLVLGAHPDDPEYIAGGLINLYRQLGRTVKMVSVTNGGAGHHQRTSEELVSMRREEAANAGQVIGSVYETWEFPDGRLSPTDQVRERIICEIRQFQPDLILTHRSCDYHPDHRAVGQAVQDASYLVTVPLVLQKVPALRKDPVVAYMSDLFTRPVPLRADYFVDVAPHLDAVVRMLACHCSQVFEWLAYQDGILDTIPDDPAERLEWLRAWYVEKIRPRAARYRQQLIEAFGESLGSKLELVEMYEISEYASQPDSRRQAELFPQKI